MGFGDFSVKGFLDKQLFGDKKTDVGIAGFTAYAKISGSVERKSTIPSTILEDGSAITDHINNDLIVVTITGNVSEVFTTPSPTTGFISDTLGSVGVITSFLPERTQAQLSRANGVAADLNSAINTADSVLDSAQKIAQTVGLIDDASTDNREEFINTVNALWLSKSQIPIETPYFTVENMSIESFVTTDNNKDDSVNFKISLKEIKTAETQLVSVTKIAPNPAPSVKGQAQSLKDKGVQAGKEPSQSFLSYAVGLLN